MVIENHYIHAATANNTRNAYQSDIRHFERFGGALPASSDAVIAYLHAYADKLRPGTLSRRLTAIKNWHEYQGFDDATASPTVRKTLKGIFNTQ